MSERAVLVGQPEVPIARAHDALGVHPVGVADDDVGAVEIVRCFIEALHVRQPRDGKAAGVEARALTFTIANGKITEIEVIGDPARLGQLDVSIVD
jgi:hypothetical protein